MKKCIIIANGKAPRKSVLEYLVQQGYTKIICADGGANSAMRLGIVPDFIIGDLDSISERALKYFGSKSEIFRVPRQNDTDVEKCLKFAIRKGYKEAVLVGVTGDRLDHTFCNLGIVLKFFHRISLKIVAEKSLLSAHSGNADLLTAPGETISVYGFDAKTKITSSGLKYPLKNTALPFGTRESTSNVAVGNKVVLKIKNGIIFVIRDFNRVRRNGHF